MTLLSPVLFIWIAILVGATWLLPRKWQVYSIALITGVFMIIYAPVSFGILIITTLFTYYLSNLRKRNAALLVLMTGVITAILLYYKLKVNVYWLSANTAHLIPLGLSYYSFRQIHYIFENYKGRLPRHHLGDYINYLFFLPTLFIGPIHRFPEFLRYSQRRRWDPNMASEGLERILYGYVKIIFLANYLVGDRFYQVVKYFSYGHPIVSEYLSALQYGLNLYFQFSGYSDVAIGLSLILGFKIIENFNYPFLAINISDFWKRWHISLSDWCREYVYLPVASATRRPYLAIVTSFLVLGLWHAVSFQYLAWGLYHGFGIAAWHAFQKIKHRLPKLKGRYAILFGRLSSNFITMNFVIVGFFITKEPDLVSVWGKLKYFVELIVSYV
jgi:alginate O-acetyltransferase complex protein AlgI